MDDFDAKLNKIVWRRPAPKKRRKIILSKKIWLAGRIFLVLVALAGGLFFSPVFKVEKIDISGTTGVTVALMEPFIRSYMDGGPLAVGGNNILLLDAGELEEKIKAEFPLMAEVRVKKDFLQRTVLVELAEKKSIGIWCVDPVRNQTPKASADAQAHRISNGADPNPCFYMERGGSIFEEAPQAEGSLILLVKTRGLSETPTLSAKVIEENLLDFMLEIKDGLFSSANVSVKEFLLRTASFDVEAVTTEGFKIFFDGKKNPDDQIANLKIMLEEKIGEERGELEYIDLREGNRIYYKLKGEE